MTQKLLLPWKSISLSRTMFDRVIYDNPDDFIARVSAYGKGWRWAIYHPIGFVPAGNYLNITGDTNTCQEAMQAADHFLVEAEWKLLDEMMAFL